MSRLIVISGVSGVGKGTVLGKMMEKRKDLSFSVSATTRLPRPGEQEGVHYYFVSQDQFQSMIDGGELLEYDNHMGNLYGTPRRQAMEKLKHGPVLLDIDPKGAAQVRQKEPDAVLIFIMPPSMEELESRLRGRGDTSEEQIGLRMKRAVWEMEQRFWYDHVVVNERDQADRCAEEILSIIERTKVGQGA